MVRTGRIPLGYFDDSEATRKTFPVVDGQRVVVSGDRASLEADGTLRLFGRDSLVVNTGGEKVFVEEVEGGAACPSRGRRCAGGRPRQRAVGPGDRGARPTAPRRRRSTPRRCTRACTDAAGAVQGAQGVHLRRQGPPARQRQGRLPVGEKPKRPSVLRWQVSHDTASALIASSTCTSAKPPSSPSSCSRCVTTTSRARSRCTTRSSCPRCSTRWTNTASRRPS